MVIKVYLAQVTYPGLFPLAPGDRLAVSEARETPSIRLEEASKEQLYTVGWFTLSFKISHQLSFRSHGRPRCTIEEKPSGSPVAPLDPYKC